MVDFGSAASAISLADKVHSLYRKIVGSIKRKPPLAAFEVRPISYYVCLSGNRPYVEVKFFAINYLSRPLILKEAKVTRLNLHGNEEIENITLVQEDFCIEAHTSQIIRCRRNLIDSETRSLSSETQFQSGSFEMIAKSRRKGREYVYGPVSSMSIEGRVFGGGA